MLLATGIIGEKPMSYRLPVRGDSVGWTYISVLMNNKGKLSKIKLQTVAK